jgi:hypothetical protein
MAWNMRISEHMKNYPDNGDHGNLTFKAETRKTYQTTPKPWYRHAEGLPYQETQKMWQAQLPLRQGTRTRKLLSFRQHVWEKPNYDLRLSQKQRNSQKGARQLPERSKTYGRNQQYQSRNVNSEGKTVEERSWYPRWKYPP